MKALRYLLLTAGLGLSLASCNSDDKEQQDPAPAPQYNLARAIVYPATAELAGVKYAPADITGQGVLNQEKLFLSFATTRDKSAVSFTINPAQLKAGVVGTYPLKSQPDQNLGAAPFHYALTLDDSSLPTRLYDSAWNVVTGEVHVTSYDEKRHLISGNYEVTMNDISDPLAPGLDDTAKKRSNMTLNGDFSNLRLQ